MPSRCVTGIERAAHRPARGLLVAGPKAWKIAKDADVTVILYSKGKVAVNHAFKKGDFKSGDIEKVVGGLPKILSTK